MIKNIEKKLNSHLLIIYTNDDSYIEPNMIKQIYEHINRMNTYPKVTMIINTRGGNLATGYKIVKIIQEKFSEINTIVVERCSSTGTLIMLASKQLYLSPYAVVTPTEPQMNAYEYGNISVNIIKKYLDKEDNNKLDPVIYGTYLSTIEYFKKICYNLFEEKKADAIIQYMLNEINNHEYPLNKEELEKLSLKVDCIPINIQNYIYKIHDRIKLYMNDKNSYENRKIAIISDNLTTIYRKKYNKEKSKIDEGYIKLEGDDFMNNKNLKREENSRVLDILEEMNESSSIPVYKDGYHDRHWDSYNDSRYHDYSDHSVYRDYSDGSLYHDHYIDSAVISEEQKEKTKKLIIKKDN